MAKFGINDILNAKTKAAGQQAQKKWSICQARETQSISSMR